MKKSIIANLEKMQKHYKNLEVLLNDKKSFNDQEKFRKISREYSHMSNVINCFEQWQKIQKNIQDLKTLSADLELIDIIKDELQNEYAKNEILEKDIQMLLLPKDPNDKLNCFIEIRAGTGGDEAAIFAGDLFRMYMRFAEICNWNTEIINTNNSQYGGFKEIIILVKGNAVYEQLKFESGGHRVQRIPSTESQGRIHTSTCTVAVIPEIPKEDLLTINTNELKIDTFRSSGAGGQHVNTTDSAVRITHLPTGIVVECQDGRSQHKNKAKALTVLGSRIHAMKIAQQRNKEADIRRNLLGSGDRSDRIRTYNFPQNRVTDHRINLTMYRLEEILNGKLEYLIKPIIQENYIIQLSLLNEY
ncbi:MAG: peptide chain release factor 1 [Pantoea sp. Brub]|nr:peptide chain release factor 1 [Pantoea sp. Brub]